MMTKLQPEHGMMIYAAPADTRNSLVSLLQISKCREMVFVAEKITRENIWKFSPGGGISAELELTDILNMQNSRFPHIRLNL